MYVSTYCGVINQVLCDNSSSLKFDWAFEGSDTEAFGGGGATLAPRQHDLVLGEMRNAIKDVWCLSSLGTLFT